MSAPQQPGYNAPVQGKSRMVAGLLNLFLCGIGAGDFYLGYTQYGIYKVIISIAFVVLGFLDLGFLSYMISLLNFVWWVILIVGAVLTFTGKWIYDKDANGVPTV